jgi:hypothetical protein
MSVHWLFIMRNTTNKCMYRYVHLPYYKQRNEGYAVYNTIGGYPILIQQIYISLKHFLVILLILCFIITIFEQAEPSANNSADNTA